MVCSSELFKVVVPNHSFLAESSDQLVKTMDSMGSHLIWFGRSGIRFQESIFYWRTQKILIRKAHGLAFNNHRYFKGKLEIAPTKLTRMGIREGGVRYKYYAYACNGIIELSQSRNVYYDRVHTKKNHVVHCVHSQKLKCEHWRREAMKSHSRHSYLETTDGLYSLLSPCYVVYDMCTHVDSSGNGFHNFYKILKETWDP